MPGHQPGRPKGEEEGPSREESDEGNRGGVSLGSLFLRWNVDLERAKLLSRNAQVYLSFQKHLIVALAAMTALCLLVLLPVNITSPIDASVLHNRGRRHLLGFFFPH